MLAYGFLLFYLFNPWVKWVWFGLLGFNASAAARVISRRWNDMKRWSVFWWRKPEYPETTDLWQVTDETFHTYGSIIFFIYFLYLYWQPLAYKVGFHKSVNLNVIRSDSPHGSKSVATILGLTYCSVLQCIGSMCGVPEHTKYRETF